MTGHPDRLGPVAQGFSHCCEAGLFPSDRVLGVEQAQGMLQQSGINPQTVTQLPRSMQMLVHLKTHDQSLLGAGI